MIFFKIGIDGAGVVLGQVFLSLWPWHPFVLVVPFSGRWGNPFSSLLSLPSSASSSFLYFLLFGFLLSPLPLLTGPEEGEEDTLSSSSFSSDSSTSS